VDTNSEYVKEWPQHSASWAESALLGKWLFICPLPGHVRLGARILLSDKDLCVSCDPARTLQKVPFMRSPIPHEFYRPLCRREPGSFSKVRRAGRADLPAIVQLHLISGPHFFLPAAGPAFLRCFYSQALRDPHGWLFVSDQNRSLAGFVVGFADLARPYLKLPIGRFPFLGAAAACLARHPIQFPGLLRDIRRASWLRSQSDGNAVAVSRLMAIAVQPWFRHQGHGKALVRALIAAARASGTQVRVSIDPNDAGMIFFYRRLGFEPLRAVRAGNVHPFDEYVFTSEMH
jgi:ribosomal protein S18 acetylase RimI-like enzyme